MGVLTPLGCRAPEVAERRTAPLVCAGRQDVPLTRYYEGPHEETPFSDTAECRAWAGHAAALEVARAAASVSTRFAAAWILRSSNPAVDGFVHATVYDVTQAQVVGSTSFLWPTSARRWLARLGYDASCSAVSGSSSCAWFTWTDGSLGSPWVNWVPVGVGATLGTTRYFAGTDGSGDIGVFDRGSGPVRTQLLAYISRDHKQVRYALLDSQGHDLTHVTLHTVTESCREADQTAVVWSPREQRFLVVWAENDSCSGTLNGRVQSRWVDGLGIAMQSATEPLTYCEGTYSDPWCAGTGGGKALQSLSVRPAVRPEAAIVKLDAAFKPDGSGETKDGGALVDAAGGGSRSGPCVCKGLYAAASHAYAVGTATDRYRVHVYGKHMRLNGAGLLASLPAYLDSSCKPHCPMDHRWPWSAPYAMAQANVASHTAEMRYLVHDGLQTQLQDTIHGSGLRTPQALRSTPNADLIATLASSSELGIGVPHTLTLTVSDGGSGGCP